MQFSLDLTSLKRDVRNLWRRRYAKKNEDQNVFLSPFWMIVKRAKMRKIA